MRSATSIASLLAAVLLALAPVSGDAAGRGGLRGKLLGAGEGKFEAAESAQEAFEARSAPGIIQPGAYSAAFASLTGLGSTAGAWKEVTTRPYNADDPRYRDPNFSNSSGGAGLVAGRTTGLAAGGGYLYAGGADGGVFRSADNGVTWVPLTDGLPTLSVGWLEIAPDGALWLGTGEANTGATAYVGTGVYRLPSPGTGVFTPSLRVGGMELESTTIGKLRFDPSGNVYAATSQGLWRHSAIGSAGAWTQVFAPTPGSASSYDNICNDLAIDPRAGGRVLIANCAWRGGAPYNGFYQSTDGGNTWTLTNPQGALNPQDVGRATLAYATDGSRLYALLESITLYTNNKNTALGGVFVSPSGKVQGPWNQIASPANLANSGSALKHYVGYKPGVQAWYNQFLIVDPANADHLFVGLEEVYETRNGGISWAAVAPYWNFEFDCWSISNAGNTCPMAPHSDQHSAAIADGTLYIGNDGGIYARPLWGQLNANGNGADWRSLNANLRTLQYYGVGVGRTAGGVAVAGGLQDNGTSLLLPEDASGQMGSPAGGDGGKIIVDPDNGCNILTEYPALDLWKITDCGRSNGSFPAIFDVAPPDFGARFIAPIVTDGADKNHWVVGGQSIWTFAHGFAITSGSQWMRAYDQGAGRATTAIASQRDVVWSAWCGPCNNLGFARGLSSNVAGSWHPLTLPAELPNRYIEAVAIDTTDASGKTVYLGFSGFSRKWTEGPGAGYGHLWRTSNGGATWADVSGTLPDIPVNDIILNNGKIIVATDLGVLVSGNGGATWKRLAANLPFTTVMDLTLGPDGLLYAATHGRGIWSIPAP
ncbi:MAG: hypothetical protein ABIO45_06905 [Burkholderiaceae bacterium]